MDVDFVGDQESIDFQRIQFFTQAINSESHQAAISAEKQNGE
jgi:hypothetical protein